MKPWDSVVLELCFALLLQFLSGADDTLLSEKMSSSDIPSQLQWWNHQSQFIISTFLEACWDEWYDEKWMTAETWVELIQSYNNDPEVLHFDVASLNWAITKTSKALAVQMDIKVGVLKNCCSIFHNKYIPRCVLSGKFSTICCYYATIPGKLPTPLKTGLKWYDEITSAILIY